MYPVLSNETMALKVHRLVVCAPRVAYDYLPGQFVTLRVDDGYDRTPAIITKVDASLGTITLVVQAVGNDTQAIVAMQKGESFCEVAGPLGRPTEIQASGRVICIGEGLGAAVLYPIVQALAHADSEVTTLVGGRSEPCVTLRNELWRFSRVVATSEDGSVGTAGPVSAAFEHLLNDSPGQIDAVYVAGSVPMMAAIARQTRPLKIRTIISLNPTMVDDLGRCRGCQIKIKGHVKVACVDGPEFDGHQVDFSESSHWHRPQNKRACRLLKLVDRPTSAQSYC